MDGNSLAVKGLVGMECSKTDISSQIQCEGYQEYDAEASAVVYKR